MATRQLLVYFIFFNLKILIIQTHPFSFVHFWSMGASDTMFTSTFGRGGHVGPMAEGEGRRARVYRGGALGKAKWNWGTDLNLFSCRNRQSMNDRHVCPVRIG